MVGLEGTPSCLSRTGRRGYCLGNSTTQAQTPCQSDFLTLLLFLHTKGRVSTRCPEPWRVKTRLKKKKKKKQTRRKLFFFIGIERFKFLLSSGWKSVAISLWGVLHGCDLGDRCRTPCYPMVFPLSPHLKNTRLTRNYTHTWRTSLAVRFRVCFADDAPDGCKVPRAPIRDGCSADGPTGIS